MIWKVFSFKFFRHTDKMLFFHHDYSQTYIIKFLRL